MWRPIASLSHRRRRPAPAGLLLLAALILPGLAGGRTAAAQAPRFLLEKITVEGVKGHGARIIVSQTYLKTGQSYTERELQEAVYRVKRLPFIVDAELSLRKGSVRGSYELVVTVEETRPLFLEFAPSGFYTAHSPGFPVTGTGSVIWSTGESLTVRQFVGAEGLAFASFSNSTPDSGRSAELGYTRYDLFGNGSYATLQAVDTFDPHQPQSPAVSAIVGLPLTLNLTLVMTPGWSRVSGNGLAVDDWSGNLALIYRTTDDPFIPTRGSDLEAVFNEVYDTFRFTFPGATGGGAVAQQSLELTGNHYWPLTPRQSVGLSLVAAGTHNSGVNAAQPFVTPTRIENAGLSLLYSASLWSSATTRRYGDLRLEANAGDTYTNAGGPFFADGRRSITQLFASAGAVYRNQWGLLRFTFEVVGREMP